MTHQTIERKRCPYCKRLSPFYLIASHVKQCEAASKNPPCIICGRTYPIPKYTTRYHSGLVHATCAVRQTV